MKRFCFNRLLLIIIFTVSIYQPLSSQSSVKIHYLGHAAFVLDFNDGITVLTDFGTSNCWGYNSPIYGIGDFIPLIMTYSHYHADHYDPDRVPDGVQYTLDMTDSLSIMDLDISPVRTCETTPGVESNTSFIFDYMGFRICHLGDAQAEIMNIADPAQQAIILEKFPEQIDMLFMTIEGVQQFIPEAEMFIDLLQPGMVVPIHYWSPEYKEEFLSYLELQNDTAGANYEVYRQDGPFMEFMAEDTIHNGIKVYGLTPLPYGETGMNYFDPPVKHLEIYPNPSPGFVNIAFSIKIQQMVIFELLNSHGQQVIPAVQSLCPAGYQKIILELDDLPAGLYFINLRIGSNCICKKLVLFP
jgi:L-ascorbate metabolism protein UlaG (beta-lactamase superfamily)